MRADARALGGDDDARDVARDVDDGDATRATADADADADDANEDATTTTTTTTTTNERRDARGGAPHRLHFLCRARVGGQGEVRAV